MSGAALDRNPDRGPSVDIFVAGENVLLYMAAAHDQDYDVANETAAVAVSAGLPLAGFMIKPAKDLEQALTPLTGDKPVTVFELNQLKKRAFNAALRCYVYSGFPLDRSRLEELAVGGTVGLLGLRSLLYPTDEVLKKVAGENKEKRTMAAKLGFEALKTLGQYSSLRDGHKYRAVKRAWGD